MNSKDCQWLLWAVLLIAAPAQAQRTHIEIVGSSTVYPMALLVAERFDQKEPYPDPVITSTGTGSGIKLFCKGMGMDTPDITLASRPIKPAERKLCADNGVQDILEIRIGYDAITLSSIAWSFGQSLDRRELFLALAARVPDPQGSGVIDNPYQTWQQINPKLPDMPIKVFAPNKVHGTYDFFVDEVMIVGCSRFTAIAQLKESNPDEFKSICTTFRQDGRFFPLELSDYTIILNELRKDPQAVGILGALFVMRASLSAIPIENNEPTLGSIAHQTYPITRPLALYVKQARLPLVPGLARYIDEFTSEAAWGTIGAYLFSDASMVPMTRDERVSVRNDVELALKRYISARRVSAVGQGWKAMQ